MRYCVFSGSSPGAREEYITAARAIGLELVHRQIGLVHSGVNVGLMGAVADAVLAEGGEVIGVIPASLLEKEIAHTGLTKLHIVDSLHARKTLMAELSDGAIALPCGLGTLEEVLELLTKTNPCGLFNTCGYFSHLLRLLDHAVAEQFLKPAHRNMVLVADDAGELLDQMKAYRHPSDSKWMPENSKTESWKRL